MTVKSEDVLNKSEKINLGFPEVKLVTLWKSWLIVSRMKRNSYRNFSKTVGSKHCWDFNKILIESLREKKSDKIRPEETLFLWPLNISHRVKEVKFVPSFSGKSHLSNTLNCIRLLCSDKSVKYNFKSASWRFWFQQLCRKLAHRDIWSPVCTFSLNPDFCKIQMTHC